MMQYLLIPGMPRSGSTSLYTYLAAHPAICGSSVKETQFFLPSVRGLPVPPPAQYARYWAHCKPTAVYRMEASASYVFGGRATAQIIRDYLGPVRLIVIMRDPIERLVSCLRHDKMVGAVQQDTTFETFLTLPQTAARHYSGIGSGFYANFLRDWLAVFPDTTRIVYLDELQTMPQQVLSALCNWLGLDPSVYADYTFTVENRGVAYRNKRLHMLARHINDRFEPALRRHPRLKRTIRAVYSRLNTAPSAADGVSAELRADLAAVYEPHNRELADLLQAHGFPLRGWLAPYQVDGRTAHPVG